MSSIFAKGEQMPLENHHVFFAVTPGVSLHQTMDQLRPWLERNEIQPRAFECMISPSGSIELQLTFESRHDASRFEQAFCQDSESAAVATR